MDFIVYVDVLTLFSVTVLEFHARSINLLPFEYFLIHHSYEEQIRANKNYKTHFYNGSVFVPRCLLAVFLVFFPLFIFSIACY